MPAAVVFPEPWSPASITTVGGFGLIVSLPVWPPSVCDELVVDDLDELLRGAQALRELRAERLLLDATDERAHDPHVDVGFEEREPDLTRDLVDVLFREAARGERSLEKMPSRRSCSASNTRGQGIGTGAPSPTHPVTRPSRGSPPNG